MEKNKQKVTNFWFGFSLGGLTIGLAAFLLGTKRGREILHKVLEMTENLDESILLLEKHFGKELENKDNSISHTSLPSLLDKIKIFSPGESNKETKKFIKST